MTVPLPKWIMQRYSILWNTFHDTKFTYEQASSLLNNEMVSIALSKLKQSGWLGITLHPEDSRKRIYKLKSPEQAVCEMMEK